jgi:hypothetical protein
MSRVNEAGKLFLSDFSEISRLLLARAAFADAKTAQLCPDFKKRSFQQE